MHSTDAIGYTASGVYVVSMLPQLHTLMSGKYDTTAISSGMFVLQLISGVLWMVYGFLNDNMPVWIFGIFATGIRILILLYLIRDRCKVKQTPPPPPVIAPHPWRIKGRPFI